MISNKFTYRAVMVQIFRHFVFFIAVFCAFNVSVPVFAQQDEQNGQGRIFEAQAQAINAVRLLAGKTEISLWGVEAIEGMPANFSIAARRALDNALGSKKMRCELKSRLPEGGVLAQCSNSSDLDLGLYMLQQGYAVVDRGAVLGSVFEEPYIEAENDAQEQKLGVWASNSEGRDDKDNTFFMILVGLLVVGILGAFVVLTMTIIRGFQRVTDAQNQSMDMMERERELREKERAIFATMLDSEIKANKSKIEAYLVVYDEMLRDMKDPDTTPKYKRAGDIVQLQPAMDRSVFDRNTDKLDILGNQLSSEVIHFYARIKSTPDYKNLEPDTPMDEAIGIVQQAYDGAQRLDKISDRLIDLFAQGGHSSEDVV